MSIYTKKGDLGETSISSGKRIDKNHIIIETNGTIDELNVVIGIVRSHLDKEHPWHHLLFSIQKDLMEIMAYIATAADKKTIEISFITEETVIIFENNINEFTEKAGNSRAFILPGGTIISSYLHLARVTARKAERRLCSLNKTEYISPLVLKYFNRISDLFFAMARYETHLSGKDEEKWKSFNYRSKESNI